MSFNINFYYNFISIQKNAWAADSMIKSNTSAIKNAKTAYALIFLALANNTAFLKDSNPPVLTDSTNSLY